LAFVQKYFDAFLPTGQVIPEIGTRITELYQTVGKLIENGNLKEALDTLFEFVRFGNKYFDTEQPWITRNTDVKHCSNTIFNCVQVIANLAVLLEPFLPFSSSKIMSWLAIEHGWKVKSIPAGINIPEPEILFGRLDKSVVDEELEKLRG